MTSVPPAKPAKPVAPGPARTTSRADLAFAPCSCFVLRRLSRTVSRLYDQYLIDVKLKTTQFSLLNHLSIAPATISELAQILGLERTSLSRNLKPLIVGGFVAVKPGADGREKALHLSPAGRLILKRGRQAWRRAQRQLEVTLGAEFVARLHGDVARVQSHVDRLIRGPNGR